METPDKNLEAKILTRIYVTVEGNLLVTDLWDEVRPLLSLNPRTEDETNSDL